LLAQGRWLSPDTPASSTTKTGRHDIAEILLKVALNTTKQTKTLISKTKTNKQKKQTKKKQQKKKNKKKKKKK